MFGINLKQYRQFLTKNERNKVYLRKNSSEGRIIADSKYKTKKILDKAGVGVPKLIKRFRTREGVRGMDWATLEGNFVIKPVSGFGGEGILIIRKKSQRSKIQSQNAEVKFQMMNGNCVGNKNALFGDFGW